MKFAKDEKTWFELWIYAREYFVSQMQDVLSGHCDANKVDKRRCDGIRFCKSYLLPFE